jgi:hypothetical protein
VKLGEYTLDQARELVKKTAKRSIENIQAITH